jgi:hypothetical protein
MILNSKAWHITILGIAFCYIGRYGGDFVEKYGSRFLDTTSLCLFFSFFLFFLANEKV